MKYTSCKVISGRHKPIHMYSIPTFKFLKTGYMSTLSCNQSRVTGTRSTLLSETRTPRNPNEICETTVFKALHIRRERSMIPKSQGISEVIPVIAPVYCLERISRLRCREREPRQSPMDPLRWRGVARSHRTGSCRDFTERASEIHGTSLLTTECTIY